MKFHSIILSLGLSVLVSPAAFAHCDTLDGPVVATAKDALAKNDVNLALVWVQKPGEAEVREAFKHTMEVRKLGGEAQKLADQYLFETLVRVHRAGEGAPFTGLKRAGLDLGPAIPKGDKALLTGDLKPVETFLAGAMMKRLQDLFREVQETKNYKTDDVEAGRKHIAAYVTYIHYAEGLYAASTGKGGEEHEHE